MNSGKELEREAEALRSRFHEAFWCEEISLYALALDKEKRQCQVRSSNAGQCLFSGIASAEHTRANCGKSIVRCILLRVGNPHNR